MVRGSWCSKSRLPKAAGAEVAVQQKKEKWHAAVARSTFAGENGQNTSGLEQFVKFRCPKMARRCGAKHVCKSKWKTEVFTTFWSLSVEKWDAAVARKHLQVKMHKTPQVRSDFLGSDIEKLLWREAR